MKNRVIPLVGLSSRMKKNTPTGAHKDKHEEKKCNICHLTFLAPNAYVRFCSSCKENSEVLRFSEWMPEVIPSLDDGDLSKVA